MKCILPRLKLKITKRNEALKVFCDGYYSESNGKIENELTHRLGEGFKVFEGLKEYIEKC